MNRTYLKHTFAGLIASIIAASPAGAQGAQDIDAMAKWTAASVIRYHVVGDYSGPTKILSGKQWSADAQVADRVEFDFDWDQTEMKIVGKPTIRNFPTKVGTVGVGRACPPTKVEGPFEFAIISAVELHPVMGMSGMLVLKATRNQPAGATCYAPIDTGVPEWETVLAKSASVDISFMVGQPLMLFTPGQAKTPDGKSLVTKGENWTWVHTPTIVK